MPLLPYPFLLRRLLLFLILALVSAGCQSGRPAFQFQPPARMMRITSPSAADQKPLVEGRPELAADMLPAAKAAASAPIISAKAAPRAARPRLRNLRTSFASGQITTVRVARRVRNLARLAGRPHRPALAPAENGLGSTFIGILGIVALLVGLIGLIFAGWGFFGWLAVAGAVALFISILAPYISGYN